MSDIKRPNDDEVTRFGRLFFGWLGVGVFLFGLGVLAYQAILWLRWGNWTPFAVRKIAADFLGIERTPRLEWRGLEQLADWVLDAPLSVGFMAFGVLLIVSAATRIVTWVCTAVMIFWMYYFFVR